ncbi:tRNA-binding protein [Elusimicrobium simillimum]|uniref:tRNA-binding protein n=1 Tax=Elusimicrobium simillimum TaxID=3143438 RepID=UPI003C6F6B90
MAEITDLLGLDIRVGVITKVEFFEGARVPAYKLEIDFGPCGTRVTSAQLTRRYNEEKLLNRRIVAVLGLPPKRIAGFKSECLVLGAVDGEGDVVLLDPGQDTPIGRQIM